MSESAAPDTPDKIYWTKDAFSLNHSFYRNTEQVGFIRDNSLSRSAEASIFGNDYLYEGGGFIRSHMDIIDMQQKEQIGAVSFNLFSTKATLYLYRSKYFWEITNLLGNKWVMEDRNGNVQFSSDNKKEGYGIIRNDNSAILLLSALVIRNHYAKQGY